jgi:cell division protein ZapA (FtsZ GTPase activity inhibitor)
LTRLIEHKEGVTEELKEIAQKLIDKWRQIAKEEKMSSSKKKEEKPVDLPYLTEEVKDKIEEICFKSEEPSYERIASLIIKTL